MNFQLKGNGFHISEHNKEFVSTMLHRIDKFQEHIEDLTITIHRETEQLHNLNADIHFHWKTKCHISHKSRELYPGLEHLFEELEKKCRREHSKRLDHHRSDSNKHTSCF